MKKQHSMLALLVVCLCFSSILEAANFYWVGASNDCWNAASYSSVKGGTGGTQMPGAATVVDIPANLSGVENLSNAKSWELSINGGDGARYSIASVTATGIRAVKPALRIILR